MQRIVSALTLALILVSFAAAQEPEKKLTVADVAGSASDQVKKEIMEVDAEHEKAIRAKDRAALNRILADNWAYTNERGQVLTKEQWINNIVDSKLSFNTIIHDDFRMDQFGDAVTVMGRSTSTLIYQGKVSKGPRRFMLVYVKMDGTWKLAAHFVSLVPHD